MKRVYILFLTYTSDVYDDQSQYETSVIGVYNTEELAKQKINHLENSIKQEEVLSYEEYTSQCIKNGYISYDPELDYHNYLYSMHDSSSSTYHYEEFPILEQLAD
jgi:hypothetical protein